MSVITRSEVKNFLLHKKGYIKKGPQRVARAIWKTRSKTNLPKTHEEVSKELLVIKEVQSNLRAAKAYIASKQEEDLLDVYNKILKAKDEPKKRLFFDIEVSPNIVLSWRVGNNINLTHNDIIKERAIICICYKWEGDPTTHSLSWDKGDDKKILTRFATIISCADEVIGQNGDAFDIKWLRTRCLYHDIPLKAKFNSLDTLKMAKAGFKFNSNKLDYMGKFLGLGSKIKTDFELWKNILLDNDENSMKLMVDYCKQDVVLLEQVYHKLQNFSPVKKFKYRP